MRLIGGIVLAAFLGALLGLGGASIIDASMADGSGAVATVNTEDTTGSGRTDSSQRPEPTTGQTQGPVVAGGEIGYVGCSNSSQTVEGYRAQVAEDPLFWSPYPGQGGDVLRWAKPSDRIWQGFDSQLEANPTPTGIWFQACESEDRPVVYEDLVQALTNLRARIPDETTIWLSPLNTYDPPTLCLRVGGDGTSDLGELVQRAVDEGLAKAGPVLGPLDESTTRGDKCHPNPEGMALLGSQLAAFFDGV